MGFWWVYIMSSEAPLHVPIDLAFLHRRCGRTVWDEAQETFYWVRGEHQPKQRLKGLTRYLKSRYYPRSRALPRVRTGGSRGGVPPSLRGVRRGRRGGEQVHRQIARAVNEGRAARDPRARLVLAQLAALGWRAVVAELPVGDPGVGVGTAADLIVVDPQDPTRAIVLEIKTGYEGVYFESQRSLKRPLACLPDSPWGQHQAQLMGTRELLLRAGVPVGRSEVWLVNARVRRFVLHPELCGVSAL